jgi:hypothetical protein
MTKYVFSDWLNGSGGPLVAMEEAKASLWTGVDGSPSDFDQACQSADYASRLLLHACDVLVLGDEPLQTAIATCSDHQLIVRWKWADSESDVRDAIDQLDVNAVDVVEKVVVEWIDQPLVLFDAADIFDPAQCLRFSTHPGPNEVSTFIYTPSPRTSLLVHSITTV